MTYFPTHANLIPGFGEEYKRRTKELHPAIVRVYARGEPIHRFESRVEINRDVVDHWGIPVLDISCKRHDNARRMLEHAWTSMQELLRSAGAEVLHEHKQLSLPGNVSHETGTARMGSDPKTSVLNGYCQAHDVKNLFIVDGAAWPSSACQNPTETLLAVTWRAADYLAEQVRKGDI